jgi:MFS family permease
VIVYAVRKLHLSPAEIGLSFSLGNAGWLVGAVTATRISARFGIGPTLVGAAALGGSGFLLIPLAPTSMAILFISVALFVFGSAPSSPTSLPSASPKRSPLTDCSGA